MGRRSADGKNRFVISGKITAFVHFLDEDAQGASERLVDDGLNFLFVCFAGNYFVILLDKQRVGSGIYLVLVVHLDLLRQKEYGESENQDKNQAGRLLPAAEEVDLSQVKPIEPDGEPFDLPVDLLFETYPSRRFCTGC